MGLPYLNLHQLVDEVSSPNRNPLIDAYVSHAERIAENPGSRSKHQAWVGGYLDHVVYATNYALTLDELNRRIGLPVDHSRGDIVLVMFLHDFGKIVKYDRTADGWEAVQNADEKEKAFLEKTLDDFSFKLTPAHLNALKYVHGEGVDYHPDNRLMSPLAVVCHQADIWSARFAPSNPLLGGRDPWEGAKRHSEMEDLVSYVTSLENLRV